MDFAVEVKNLVKVYQGKVRALDGIDLRVEAGTVFTVLGPNGAGKTTLIRILTSQLNPTSGEAFVFGLNATREGTEVRRLISYVPQEVSVWTDISGFENLLIYSKIYRMPPSGRVKAINEALESMGLGSVKNNLVKTYSGGMVRRLEIACALLIKPKILFLDEPTIGLDPSARKVVWEKLTSFRNEYGVTVFFNTHYMDEADLYSDRIAIMERGKIVTTGTAEDLKRSMGGDVILFGLVEDGIGNDIVAKVKGLSLVKDVVLHDSEMRVVVNNAEVALPEVISMLVVNGVATKTISVTKPTLDDVFLKYAGTRLDVGGRIGEVAQVRRMIKRG